MTEDEVRCIVRDEISLIERERAARNVAAADQHMAAVAELTADDPDDGPVVRELKKTLRGDPESESP